MGLNPAGHEYIRWDSINPLTNLAILVEVEVEVELIPISLQLDPKILNDS